MLSVMDKLDTAECVTRYLRCRDGSLDQIILTANQLVESQLDIYLPNKNIFVFELLCDRLNDSSTPFFKKWKFDIGVWCLLKKVWDNLNDNESNRSLRYKAFKRVKFIEVIITIFASSPSNELLDIVFECVKVIMSDAYIEIDDNLSIDLLSSYVSTIQPNNKIEKWTSIVQKMYLLPQMNVSYKPNKKKVAKFVHDCLPNIISFIADNPDLAGTNKILQNIISRVLFHKETIGSIKPNIDLLLQDSSEHVSVKSIEYLFKLIVSNLSNKDVKICEELYISITSTKEFNDMSEVLLGILSGVNKSLSNEFFRSIYDKEVEAKKPNEVNWYLVIHLIALDVELALNNSKKILSRIPTNEVNKEISLRIGENIIDAYVKARELIDFFEIIWIDAIKANSFWKSNEFVNLVATKINYFSSNQLVALSQSLLSKDDVIPLIISIIKGLLNCSSSKSDSIKSVIFKTNDFFSNKSTNYWEIRYYILCLYGEDALAMQEQLVDLYEKHQDSKYYYYSLFRLVELIGNDNFVKGYHNSFIEFLSKNPSEVEFLLNRWIVIINKLFNKDQINSIITLIMKSLEPDKFFQFLNNDGEIFFEQKYLTNSLISYILNEIESDPASLSKLIAIIPVQCFDKHSKKKSLDILYKLATSTTNGKINLESRSSLNHLLIQPSFRSTIELEFSSLLEVFKTSKEISKDMSTQIINTIWANHLNQYNLSDNKKYILDSLIYLNSFLQSFEPQGKLSPEFEISLIILLIGENHINDVQLKSELSILLDNFTNAINKLLHYLIDSNNGINHALENWLLNSLYLISDIESDLFDDTLALVKTIGSKISNKEISKNLNITRTNLFNLLTKLLRPSFKNSIFILSLFISLKSNFKVKINNALSNYLNRLSQDKEEFESIFLFVLQSISESNIENIDVFIQIIDNLIRSLKKEYQKESIKLFIKTLSIILTNYDIIDFDSILSLLIVLKNSLSDMIWLFNQYSLETTITLITKIANSLNNEKLSNSNLVEVYIQLTQVMSHILLFHRFRLSSRHHIIMNSFIALLEPLSLRNHNEMLSNSSNCAIAYSRLLSNLCEPSNTTSKEIAQTTLNSTSALIKRSLRKHLPVLLVNYIYFNLKFNFNSKINDELINGIYNIFDVLSATELQLVNASLDIPGKTYYRTLYSNYKGHGKWRDD